MLPFILAGVGGYLIGEGTKDKQIFDDGGMMDKGGDIDKELFVANKNGIIEVYSGSDARSAEVKVGDIFVVKEEMENETYYLGKLKIKGGSFKLDAGLSGKDVSKMHYENLDEVLYLLRKNNIGGDSSFFAQFKKIKL
jgi:hypothetical protein